jgi:hypothetical protein
MYITCDSKRIWKLSFFFVNSLRLLDKFLFLHVCFVVLLFHRFYKIKVKLSIWKYWFCLLSWPLLPCWGSSPGSCWPAYIRPARPLYRKACSTPRLYTTSPEWYQSIICSNLVWLWHPHYLISNLVLYLLLVCVKYSTAMKHLSHFINNNEFCFSKLDSYWSIHVRNLQNAGTN